MAAIDSEILPLRRRSTARVEIWRNEVATAVGASPLPSPDTESSVSSKSRPTSPSSSGRRKSFITFTKTKTSSTEHVPHPFERPGLLARVKMGLKLFKPKGVERTGMYHEEADGDDAGGVDGDAEKVAPAENEEVRVVDIIESISDVSGEKGGLLARQERLDRAAKLLEKST